jgi:hypothetical protein
MTQVAELDRVADPICAAPATADLHKVVRAERVEPFDYGAIGLAQAAMGKPETKVGELCAELGVTRQTLYRHVSPDGQIRADGENLLGRKGPKRNVLA